MTLTWRHYRERQGSLNSRAILIKCSDLSYKFRAFLMSLDHGKSVLVQRSWAGSGWVSCVGPGVERKLVLAKWWLMVVMEMTFGVSKILLFILCCCWLGWSGVSGIVWRGSWMKGAVNCVSPMATGSVCALLISASISFRLSLNSFNSFRLWSSSASNKSQICSDKRAFSWRSSTTERRGAVIGLRGGVDGIVCCWCFCCCCRCCCCCLCGGGGGGYGRKEGSLWFNGRDSEMHFLLLLLFNALDAGGFLFWTAVFPNSIAWSPGAILTWSTALPVSNAGRLLTARAEE